MSETEPKVSLTSETESRRQQWGKGLLYRDDGRKRTLVSRQIVMIVGIGFAVISAGLLLESPPETKAPPKPRADFRPPSGIASVSTIQIPEVARPDTAREPRGGTPPTSALASESPGHGSAGKSKSRYRGPQVVARPRAIKIPPGSMIKATLVSGASNGPVRAEVTEGLSVAGELLIPTGTILLGQGQSGDERLNIHFRQMVFQDGAVETVDAQACDASDKIAGLRGSRVNGQVLKLAMGIGLNFAGGASDALQDSTGQFGAVVRPPSLRNAMLNGAGTAALAQSREIMSDVKNKPPVYEIPAGTEVLVLFQKD